jgi:hypothetical protein
MPKINVLMSQHSAGLKNLTVQVLSMLKVMIDGNSFFKILDGPCHRKKHLEMSKHYEQKFGEYSQHSICAHLVWASFVFLHNTQKYLFS